MATKRKRGNTWHYTVRRAGVLPKPIYLTFDDDAEGDAYVRRLEALLDRGIVPDEFNEKREVQRSLRWHVRRYLGEQPVKADDHDIMGVVLARLPQELQLSDITYAWATSWVSTLKREQNLSPSTIRKHVGTLARAFDWLTGHGHLPFNALRQLPRGYAQYSPADATAVARIEGKAKDNVERDRRLEPAAGDDKGEEARIREILAGAKPEGRQRALELPEAAALELLFDMALESAMRMREMYTLSVRQIDLAKSTIFLDKTKNGDKRQVPITSVLRARLQVALKGRKPDELLFPWWDGDLDRRSLERVTSRLSRQFARIFDAAGAKDLHFHDLRHEATSRLYERTKLSDLEISKITGHKDPRMLKRYANLRGSDLAARLW